MTELKYPKRWPFVLSGIFMMICSIVWYLRYLEPLISMIEYGMGIDWIIAIFGCSLLFFVLGIVLMAAKNSVGTIVLFGMYTLLNLYWMRDIFADISYYMSDVEGMMLLLLNVFDVVALVYMTIVALVSRINQKNSFVKTWFIPFILEVLTLISFFVLFFINLVNNASLNLVFNRFANILFNILFAMSILFYGLGLKVAMNKKPTVKVGSDVNLNNQNTTIVQQRVNEPTRNSFGANVQMSKPSPIMPPIGQARQESRTSDEKMEEVRKYKQLLDDGIITEEEFNRKKQEILGV